jgi:hypothetical protein
MARPIPQTDEEAVRRSFELRDQSVSRLAKRWFGGPWHVFWVHVIPIPYQGGRPYMVTVSGAQGEVREAVAVDGVDVRGDPEVFMHEGKAWSRISRLRPAHTPLILEEPDLAR